jgi:hypothetical protein
VQRRDQGGASLPRAVRLESALTMADWSMECLWCAYVALGGNARPAALEAMVRGDRDMPRWDYNVVALALNERFAEAGFGYPLEYLYA